MSCGQADKNKKDPVIESQPEIVIKKRSDGTISPANQVDDFGKVHGIRVTYYEDGKTVYSKHTFLHGRKHGPSNWYYINGQVFKETNFENGKRQGITTMYYKNGDLLAVYESEK